MKTEGIRALIHPSEKYVETMSASFADGKRRNEEMLKHMQEIVDKVNKDLLPYKRISRVDLVDEPFEMSSTKKIKRFIYAEKYKYL
jgi:long-chain acyl-CoA synthetase